MLIQIIVTIVVVLFVLPNLISFFKRKLLTPVTFVFWVLCWIGGLFLIWFPHIITIVGEELGVGRSIDAFVYLSIVYLLYTSLMQKIKLNQVNKDITILNRKLALKEINKKKKSTSSDI